MKKLVSLFFFILLAFQTSLVHAQEYKPEYSIWLGDLIKEAIQHGVRPQTAYNALANVEFDPSIIEKDRKQPESQITAQQYWKKIITSQRMERAKSFYNANRVLLNQIGDTYGVQPRFLVAILSIESNFGDVQGEELIIPALTSLSYDGRRTAFFKGELFNALKIIDKGHITQEEMVGSWAGAMGWCQFMPSTFLKYAVDFDGDGRTDIWHSVADAAASAANYMHEIGWRSNETWGRQVRLTKPVPEEFMGRDVRRPISEWAAMGVRAMNGKALPENKNMEASLITPDGSDGVSFLVYNNFNVIMQWNKSTYFATSIGMIADKLGNK
ncbi:MAG: lytic murein transglycosylase [Alphaproteobacteria bacterium]|nr:lytic murein transglycosylase [Alphaproteobacteria bacterium]